MNEIVFDPAICRGCGTCSAACTAKLIIMEKGHPRRRSSIHCHECFHCVAACPTGAADVSGFPHETVKADGPFLSLRSCRKYTPDPVDRSTLASLAIRADQAPHMSRPKARRYVFVTEPGALAVLRNAIAPWIHLSRRLFHIMSVLPFLPKDSRRKFRGLLEIFTLASSMIKTGRDIFHGAPVLVLVTGSRAEGMNKEDGVYAMHQLLLLAETEDLGSCINGFTAGFPWVTARALGLPKGQEVWTAATLGHPVVRYNRVVLRKDLDIQWK